LGTDWGSSCSALPSTHSLVQPQVETKEIGSCDNSGSVVDDVEVREGGPVSRKIVHTIEKARAFPRDSVCVNHSVD
jgi:hypothetical protein